MFLRKRTAPPHRSERGKSANPGRFDLCHGKSHSSKTVVRLQPPPDIPAATRTTRDRQPRLRASWQRRTRRAPSSTTARLAQGVFNYLGRVDKFDQAANAPVCRHSLELRRVETKAPTDPGYLGHKFESDSIWIVHDRALAVIVEDERPIVFVASKLPIDSLPECDDVSSANRRMVSALHKLGCDVAELQGIFAPFGRRVVIW